MSKHKISLQARLTLLVLFAVLLFGLSAGYESYKSATHEADEIFDAQLAQIAQSLALLARTFEDEHTDPMPPPIHKYQQSLATLWFRGTTTGPRCPGRGGQRHAPDRRA